MSEQAAVRGCDCIVAVASSRRASFLREFRRPEPAATTERLERVFKLLNPTKIGTTPVHPGRNERSRTDAPHGAGEVSHVSF